MERREFLRSAVAGLAVSASEASAAQQPPGGTRDAVLAAFRVGAPGVVLSRKYSEMKLANLAAAGEAIRQLGYA